MSAVLHAMLPEFLGSIGASATLIVGARILRRVRAALAAWRQGRRPVRRPLDHDGADAPGPPAG
ncbi:hypothetical protein [Streptomyces erythrochromogenes]|uniref:hypothetical protein n=1 Tax=Streptomyces erythrochromogenes TaxID=285574 RepID=UPI00341918A8